MTLLRRLIAIAIALAAGTLCFLPTLGNAADVPAVPPRERAPNDTAEYRRFVLPNGIKVILQSDARLNKSSVALAVGAGNLADPPNRQGMAHFLEHMLFLGTQKYPNVSDFDTYLSNNGGGNNAYTARDRTHYFLEVRHEAFEGALDRFSQFFIAPLFSPEFRTPEEPRKRPLARVRAAQPAGA
jgi:secreted Zn-dependent insulinase-like peptidase